MSEEENNPTKKSFVSKILGWIIKIIIFIALFYFILMYFEGRQEEFITTSIEQAKIKCNNDKSCLNNIKLNGRKCVQDNHHQERISKRAKKSALDEEAFYACLDSFKKLNK